MSSASEKKYGNVVSCQQNTTLMFGLHWLQVPCMDYSTIAKNAVLEGPNWMHKFATSIE